MIIGTIEMNPRHVVLNDVETLEDFSKYAIDVDGNLWSLQYKYPKLRKPVMSSGYLSVKLRDDYKNLKTVYIHKLVALAFLPTDNIERGVRHKNKDRTDNRLENIEWIVRKDQQEQANDYILNGVIIERIQQVHRACQRKGIRVPDSYQFTNMMINNALDEYIIRYGLRKVML
jgi:hypothetical protein